jgi:hypothetical protein
MKYDFGGFFDIVKDLLISKSFLKQILVVVCLPLNDTINSCNFVNILLQPWKISYRVEQNRTEA